MKSQNDKLTLNPLQIQKLMLQSVQLIPLQQENAVLLVGETGGGKSTIVNYIAGKQLDARLNRNNDIAIYVDQPLKFAEVSDTTNSQSKIPSKYEIYWDLPGLFDTKGPVHEIVNAFSKYTLIKNSSNVKFVLVVQESTMKDIRLTLFIQTLKRLEQMLLYSDELFQGLCLIVTQRELKERGQMDHASLRLRISNLLKDREEWTDSKFELGILKALSMSDSNIAFFDQPSEQGKISDQNRVLILAAIHRTHYLNRPAPSISISGEAKELIKDLLYKLYEDIQVFVPEMFCQAISNYLKESLDAHGGGFDELRSELQRDITQLGLISNQQDWVTFQSNLLVIQEIVKQMGREDLLDRIQTIINQLEFIKIVKPEDLEIKGNTSSWYSHICHSLNDIKSVIKPPEEVVQDDTLTLRGLIASTEDLRVLLTKYKDLREVNVYCLHTIYIDGDLTMPGVNLNLISPNCIVVGRRKIDLKGKKGDWQEQVQQQISMGEKGLPGKPGFSGGNFLIKVNNFFNLDRLTIDVSGGMGGQGQQGENGKKGSNGGKVGMNDKIDELNSVLLSRKKIDVKTYAGQAFNIILTQNEQFEENYKSFWPGQKGGLAGYGGIGGLGGNTGTVNKNNLNIIVLSQQGLRGDEGQGGMPGIGGKNGPLCKFAYINEYVCPTIRGIKEIEFVDTVVQPVIGPLIGGVGGIVAAVSTQAIRQGGASIVRQGGVMVVKGSLCSSSAIGAVVGLAIQAIVSPISAFCSSRFLNEPEVIQAENEVAPNGDSNELLKNVAGIIEPNKPTPIDEKNKMDLYHQFRKESKANSGLIKEFKELSNE